MDGELMDAVVLLSVALKKKGKELFYITVLQKANTFPKYQGKGSTELSFLFAALELGDSHCFISSWAGVTVQGRKQISFY